MPDSVTSISQSGYATENRFDDHTVTVDSREETGPNPTATLLGAYASCYVVGLRIAAADRGYPDLGRIEIDVTGHRDADRELEAIEFELALEADIPHDDAQAIADRALETCHVGTALRDDLAADVTIRSE